MIAQLSIVIGAPQRSLFWCEVVADVVRLLDLVLFGAVNIGEAWATEPNLAKIETPTQPSSTRSITCQDLPTSRTVPPLLYRSHAELPL
jgi:hypothetical protein